MAVEAKEVLGSAVERVSLGAPAASAVLAEAERQAAKRVFLLVSTHLNTKTDEIERIRQALGARHAATHHGIRPHVPKSDLLAAVQHAREVDADLIVTVGGGSVSDAGKILALCLAHDVRSVDDLNALRLQRDAEGRPVPGPEKGPDIRIVCVPTTLSAGEFNPQGASTDEALGHKQSFRHIKMTPACIVLDPAITVHTPEWLWLSTGMRAVDHAVETLASLRSNDFADGLADNGLRLLNEGLSGVKADPGNLDARLKCQTGAWMSILPIIGGVPMGASHAIGHALGSFCKVPHGYTSCVMAPYVQQWNADVVPDRQRRIAACLGEPAQPAYRTLDRLIRSLGLPRTLAEVDVRDDQLDRVADLAFNDFWGRTNPRPVRGPQDMLEILQLARG
ncbi:MAG: iron-containing alcohol dehydrogenase [Janthinobacterium lividum]